MTAIVRALDFRTLLRKQDLQPTAILLLAALMVTVHRCFGSTEFAAQTFAQDRSLEASLFMFVSTFLLLGLLPLAVTLFGFRDRPKKYGLALGNWRLGILLTIVLFPLIAVCLLYPASQTAEMRNFHPFAVEARMSLNGFLLYQIPHILFFYTAWEFFFRGFMLFGLRKAVGDWLAICIQTVPQCLWHIGMPTGEILSSIVGGILFGLMAIRTRSVVWPLVLHCLIGIALDSFIVVTS